MRAMRPSPAAAVISRLSAAVIRDVCTAALAGKELYLNGSYSGTTSIHRAFSTTGPSRLIVPARPAAGDTPIIGEQDELGRRRQRRIAKRVEGGHLVTSAPPFEYPTITSGASVPMRCLR